MSKLIYLSGFLIILFSCQEKHDKTSQKIETQAKYSIQPTNKTDTVIVIKEESSIIWKGTKMHGLGKHEGTVELQEGYLLLHENTLIGGKLIANMNTIKVTDIPKTDPIPIKNLTNHLKDSDFFNVKEYPQAIFEFLSIKKVSDDSLHIKGNFTIKGITNLVDFKALFKNNTLKATLKFNRYHWNIAYTGSWLDKTLVDKDIILQIHLTY